MDHCAALSVIFLSCVLVVGGYVYEEPIYNDTFPDGFAWGVATAAYQIEGGWNEGGKTPSIWDTFTEAGTNIDDGSSGQVACDSYHKYAEDVQLIKAMGMTHYRFSIAWTRILPNGTGEINQEGVNYYQNLINELKNNGIVPVATLYHWDLPQVLQDRGGWLNSDVAFWFEEYARACFASFGNDVKMWITLNEPWVTAVQGHGIGDHAPGITEIGTGVYDAAHNQIRAHAKAYRAYESDFKPTQLGQCGVTLNINWAEPEVDDDPDYVDAADRKLQFDLGWFAHPILLDGFYPPIMRQKIDEKSEAQGYAQSRLPFFTPDESIEIGGSADFLGINHYTSSLVAPKDSPISDVSYFADSDTSDYQDKTWYPTASSWHKVAPFGIRPLMNWIWNEYGSYPIYITENGYSDYLGNLDDLQRIYFYKHYINNLLKAVKIDGVDIRGYFAWSLMDNFEWARGYTEKFGVHAVDMNDPNRPRSAKQSSVYLKELAEQNGFVPGSGPCSNGP